MADLFIRKIQKEDNDGVAHLIRKVMPEFGASGPGFAIHDPEVSQMFEAYQQQGRAYFVVTDGAMIFGGAGVAPLPGEEGTCELRKMYFMSEIRGKGLGQKLMDECLKAAKEFGYETCYLETLKSMQQAKALYQKNNFIPLSAPLGDTGHFSCDSWFHKSLTE
ncbi:MAG TPA: GNAT family N-acetyltransferase [Bacteriovoracaceae bacterium]|nr:GNAT family N-acetyltransferase [Bacteriovoracaceae bacterium]